MKNLVASYSRSMVETSLLEREFPGIPLRDQVLCHKMAKYSRIGNYRKVAQYLTLYLRSYGAPLPAKAKELAKAAGHNLQSSRGKVGYLHIDGTYHQYEV